MEPQVKTSFEIERQNDFEAVRRVIAGRKFTAFDALRLRDLIRVQTIPDSNLKPARHNSTAEYLERYTTGLLGIHLSKEHANYLKHQIDLATVLDSTGSARIKEVLVHRHNERHGHRPKAADFTDSQWEDFER